MFQIRLRFPGVFARRVVSPFDEELHLPVSFPMSDDRFHFPFFLLFDNDWLRFRLDSTRNGVCDVRGEKRDMEHRMDLHLEREFQFVGV